MSELDIGILALQGDVAENFMSTMMAMNELGIDGSVSQVKTPDQISAVDGLIVPGGESTMMGQLSMVNGAMNALKEKIESEAFIKWLSDANNNSIFINYLIEKGLIDSFVEDGYTKEEWKINGQTIQINAQQ